MENNNAQFTITVNNLDIDNYGGVILPITGEDFFKKSGFNMLDIVDVDISGHKAICPIVPDYNYIDSGVCAISPVNGMEKEIFLLAIGGQFAVLTELAKRTKNGWVVNPTLKFPLEVKFSLNTKDGYRETFEIYAYLFARRSNNREDYPELNDAEYCNFRTVTGGSIKPGILFRTSNPLKPRFKRNWYSDKECEKAGISKFINISENQNEIDTYKNNPEYEKSYCLKQEILANCVPADYKDEYFLECFKNALLFMAKDKRKSVIHCMEGKDRTGYMVAVLQALMGATTKEIMEDYSKSHCNFFKVNLKDHTMPLIQRQIIDYLNDNLGGNINDNNLTSKANEYLLNIGLNPAEVQQIKRYLRGE